MTSDDYRAAIAALDLSQVGAARLLGVDERTSRRWAHGERTVPKPVARFLTFLIRANVNPQDVMDVLEGL